MFWLFCLKDRKVYDTSWKNLYPSQMEKIEKYFVLRGVNFMSLIITLES